jgi:hypothetical protein
MSDQRHVNGAERAHSTYEEKKTAWAHLGYAIMKCQVLEHRLADVLFMCQMLNGDKTWADKDTHVPRYQKQTMGWLKNRLCEVTALPVAIEGKLKEVCEIRNELAHRYFKTRIDLLLTRQGYGQIASEIDGMASKIEDVITAFHAINARCGEPLGYTDEAIDRVAADFGRYLASLPEAERKKFERGHGRPDT